MPRPGLPTEHGSPPSWATWQPFADRGQPIDFADYRDYLDAYAPERDSQEHVSSSHGCPLCS